MKNKKIFSLIAVCLIGTTLLVGCSKDENVNNNISNNSDIKISKEVDELTENKVEEINFENLKFVNKMQNVELIDFNDKILDYDILETNYVSGIGMPSSKVYEEGIVVADGSELKDIVLELNDVVKSKILTDMMSDFIVDDHQMILVNSSKMDPEHQYISYEFYDQENKNVYIVLSKGVPFVQAFNVEYKGERIEYKEGTSKASMLSVQFDTDVEVNNIYISITDENVEKILDEKLDVEEVVEVEESENSSNYSNIKLGKGFSVDTYYGDEESKLYASLLIGETVPNIKWKNSIGKDFSTNTLDKDRYILEFFMTTCEHCNKSIPEVDIFREAHPNMNVVSLSFDTGDLSEFNKAGENAFYIENLNDEDVMMFTNNLPYVPAFVYVEDGIVKLILFGGQTQSSMEEAAEVAFGE